jgi:two-component system, chemotaxis family, protein-glutamate methylesterase/glutaminase
MPASFTRPFAERMNLMCPLTVTEVAQPMKLEPGMIYIGKGGADMVLGRRNGILTVLARPESKEFMWHPSVELMGRSALECCDPTLVIGVLLTGMGYDGADAFTEIKKLGGRTIAESEESAVVFGMPAELISRDGASLVMTADKVARQLITWVGR